MVDEVKKKEKRTRGRGRGRERRRGAERKKKKEEEKVDNASDFSGTLLYVCPRGSRSAGGERREREGRREEGGRVLFFWLDNNSNLKKAFF